MFSLTTLFSIEQTKIVAGEYAPVNQYPYMVALLKNDGKADLANPTVKGGATLSMSDTIILHQHFKTITLIGIYRITCTYLLL